MAQHWEVVGGGDKGGILVRSDVDVTSAELPSRLSTGAVVKELALEGDRLQYQRLTGSGPETGWVSVKLSSGKDLLVKRGPLEKLSALQPNSWRVMYFETPTRGEQLRLLFHMTGTPFEDIKLPVYPTDLEPYKILALGDESPLKFDQAPIVQFGYLTICQVAAGMQFVGEKLGLIEDTPEARAEAAMLMLGSEEMRNKLFYDIFGRVNGIIAESQGTDSLQALIALKGIFLQEFPHYNTHMNFFERHLRLKHATPAGGPFLLGKKLCYADVGLYDCLDAIWSMPVCEKAKDRKKKFPILSEFFEAVRQYPGLKEHLDKRTDFWTAINKVWKGEKLP